MTFGERLKHFRELRGLSQPALGELLSTQVKGGTISSWEVGRTEPTLTEVLELTHILYISLDDLICDDSTPLTLPNSLKLAADSGATEDISFHMDEEN